MPAIFGSLSVACSSRASTIYSGPKAADTADIINKAAQCAAAREARFNLLQIPGASLLNQGDVGKRERAALSALICANSRISGSRRPNSRFIRIYPGSGFWKMSPDTRHSLIFRARIFPSGRFHRSSAEIHIVITTFCSGVIRARRNRVTFSSCWRIRSERSSVL